jgi:uncharacterized protein
MGHRRGDEGPSMRAVTGGGCARRAVDDRPFGSGPSATLFRRLMADAEGMNTSASIVVGCNGCPDSVSAGALFELSAAECRELLRAGLVGRVALCTPLGPHIVPVNYSVLDDTVIVRTTPYSVLGTHARGSILALEVDHVDYERHHGWSVVVRGRADIVTGADELEAIKGNWEPRPWVAGSRSLFLHIRWTELTGRRLGAGWQPVDELPVHQVLKA